MAATRFAVVVHLVTAGQQGDALGSDEQDTVVFSWLVVDLANNKVVAVQQNLVKPRSCDVNENVISESCRTEYGISEEQLKNAVPLEQVIDQFSQWARARLEAEAGGQFYFVTDGQLTLRQALHPEAVRHGILLPDTFYHFFDLRKEFQAFYGKAVESVQDMLAYLSLEPDASAEVVTRHVQDMAKVILRLNMDGHKFTNPEEISQRLESGICSKTDVVDSNTVVRARGLPWQSSDQDIAKFFSGLNIVKGGVALCLSPQGRRNGEALVRFENSEHRDMALKRHKHHIGQRYIEVYRATGEDFVNVAGGNNNEAHSFLSRGGQVIVRMRGLPYDCTAKQVVEFFASSGDGSEGSEPHTSCPVMDDEDGVLFVRKPDGRATGDAFVLFDSEEVASRALHKHRQLIGSRYIELFRSTTAEVQQVLNRTMDPRTYDTAQPLIASLPQVPLLPQQMLPSRSSRKDCIRLRGLPYEAQVETILEFLGEHSQAIVYQGVHMVYNAQGQPSGEAFIQMDSEDSAFLAALQRHHRYIMGKKPRYIEVFQCSIDDMNLVLTGGIPVQRPLLTPAHCRLYPDTAQHGRASKWRSCCHIPESCRGGKSHPGEEPPEHRQPIHRTVHGVMTCPAAAPQQCSRVCVPQGFVSSAPNCHICVFLSRSVAKAATSEWSSQRAELFHIVCVTRLSLTHNFVFSAYASCTFSVSLSVLFSLFCNCFDVFSFDFCRYSE
ncbi:epithelial splicing regulatory protein fusilli isoform X1 [Rhipicephalus microplus]|uniref:epithelial splicing regulatory protein fusilli isoform X1 n=1 Tax=Rhipicephalus microplus TaxID=6941 RepID=UPI003F6C44D4